MYKWPFILCEALGLVVSKSMQLTFGEFCRVITCLLADHSEAAGKEPEAAAAWCGAGTGPRLSQGRVQGPQCLAGISASRRHAVPGPWAVVILAVTVKSVSLTGSC